MSHESNSYSSKDVKLTKWGKFHQREDGFWETVWDLKFVRSQELGEFDVYRDDDIGFSARLKKAGGSDGRLLVQTRERAMSAEYYSPTFICFRIVNDELAEILTIEGLPRDWYSPFRDRLRDT